MLWLRFRSDLTQPGVRQVGSYPASGFPILLAGIRIRRALVDAGVCLAPLQERATGSAELISGRAGEAAFTTDDHVRHSVGASIST